MPESHPENAAPPSEEQRTEQRTEQRPPEPNASAAQGAAPGAAAGVDPERQRLEEELAAARRRVDELARAYQAVSQDREEFKQRLTRERERMLDVERGK